MLDSSSCGGIWSLMLVLDSSSCGYMWSLKLMLNSSSCGGIWSLMLVLDSSSCGDIWSWSLQKECMQVLHAILLHNLPLVPDVQNPRCLSISCDAIHGQSKQQGFYVLGEYLMAGGE